MNISDVLRAKHGDERPAVVTIDGHESVGDLLQRLAEHNVGALVVADSGAAPPGVAGIVSERDVVRRLAEHGGDLLDHPVSSIMTAMVASCTSEDSVDAIAAQMTERRVRHMPVIDSDRLVGIVSIGDVVSSHIRQLEHDRGQLEQYISS